MKLFQQPGEKRYRGSEPRSVLEYHTGKMVVLSIHLTGTISGGQVVHDVGYSPTLDPKWRVSALL